MARAQVCSSVCIGASLHQPHKNSPQVIFPDSRNGEHLANFTSDALQFDSDVSAPLNDLIGIVCKLGWGGISVKFDVRWDHLYECEQRVALQVPSSTYSF